MLRGLQGINVKVEGSGEASCLVHITQEAEKGIVPERKGKG